MANEPDRNTAAARPYRQLRHDETVDEAARAHGDSIAATLPILQDVDQQTGYLPSHCLGAVADVTGQSDADVYGVATFYSMFSTRPRTRQILRVCDGPVCALLGGCQIRQLLEQQWADDQRCAVQRSSCLGLCDRAPAALLNDEPCGPLSVANAADILDGFHGQQPSYATPLPGERRVAMQRIGRIDAESIDDALAAGAYQALADALQQAAGEVLREVERSGLQGRGGAGFPTGNKWRYVADADAAAKYVICNADESEPGAFKDRVLMEGDPHLLVEGMLLAGYATGARYGIIYVRGEYAESARLLQQAIRQAREAGWLGQSIQGSDFSFDIEIHRGAGAYICGEETALLESLEGRRGEPRVRPPFPTASGHLGCPTVINNVETLCAVPAICQQGADWYRSLGSKTRPGTKMFTVTGHVNRPGAFETPFGVTLRQIVEDFGGGMRADSRFKMALTGGAAGTIVPASLLDVPLEFGSQAAGVALGSGVVMVMDHSVSVAQLLHWLLHFFEVESCGKCTPCRVGTRHARMVVEEILDGVGGSDQLAQLARLAKTLEATSLCGLGKSVAWPIDSALQHFGAELGA